MNFDVCALIECGNYIESTRTFCESEKSRKKNQKNVYHLR